MLDEKETTVYKRALDMAYNLKIKASRAVYGEVRRTPGLMYTVQGSNVLSAGVVPSQTRVVSLDAASCPGL
jgi:hypothetical protein